MRFEPYGDGWMFTGPMPPIGVPNKHGVGPTKVAAVRSYLWRLVAYNADHYLNKHPWLWATLVVAVWSYLIRRPSK